MEEDVLESEASDVPLPAGGREQGGAPCTAGEPVKVRPIQMGEFMRKYVSRRLLAINSADTAKTLAAMRQLGAGTAGGAEALAIFHQLLFDAWTAGRLNKTLARVKVDETNCFGSLEWDAVRKASMEFHPRHAAVAAWKHAATSYVEQQGVAPQPKDREAEQGDVDGPQECSFTLGVVGQDARAAIHQQQRLGHLPWASDSLPEVNAAREDFDNRQEATRVFQERRASSTDDCVDPRLQVQQGGGLADFWYLDDGDVLCCPLLVNHFLVAFDQANPQAGAKRSKPKTEVIFYCSQDELDANSQQWALEEIRQLESVSTADKGSVTLGVATGPDEYVAEQLKQKARVVKAMHERVQLCQDPQTEFVLARQSLGVSTVNHILRVRGARLGAGSEAAVAFDDVGKATLDRLVPGLTDEGHVQASLGDRLGGAGCRRAAEVTLPANLGALIATRPLVMSMIAATATAGLCSAEALVPLLDQSLTDATVAYLACLAEVEKIRAEEFLQRARAAADESWSRTLHGAA